MPQGNSEVAEIRSLSANLGPALPGSFQHKTLSSPRSLLFRTESNQVRIYVADLPKKYNYDLIGALSAAPDHNQQEFLSHITSNPHGRLLNATSDDSEDLRQP